MSKKGLNKVMLIGNLGVDPEMRYTPQGQPVTNFTLATNRTYKGKDGVEKTETEWHRITVWSKLAEIANEYLKKGQQVYVEGRLQTDSYVKEGVTHYSTKIVVNEMIMLSAGNGAVNGNGVAEEVEEAAVGEVVPF